MKKRTMIVPAILCTAILLSACGKESPADTSSVFEPVESDAGSQQDTSKQDAGKEESQQDAVTEAGEASVAEGSSGTSDVVTNDQALRAAFNYYTIQNPGYELTGENGEYWDVVSENPDEITAIYRSYTGAINRYYVNPTSGETYVTEFVPGIIDEEQKTGETFNIRDYFTDAPVPSVPAADSSAQSTSDAPVSYEDADGFMGSFLLSSDRDKIGTTDEFGVFYRVVYRASIDGDELTVCGSMDYRNFKDQDPITITDDQTHIFEVTDSTVYVMDGAESGKNNVSKEEFAGLLDKLKDSGVFLEVEVANGTVATATIIS